MFISIDFKRVRNHISILQAEEKSARELVETLTCWYGDASLDKTVDSVLIKEYITIVQQQMGCIQQRMTFLEDVVDKFVAIKNKTDSLMEDAIKGTRF